MSQEPGEGDREVAAGAGQQRAARKHGSRILKLALLGGAVALVLSEDVRNQLLDALFGAEEEFDYSSLTEPPEPSKPPEHSPSEPFVRTPAKADDVAPAEPFVRTTSDAEAVTQSDADADSDPAPVTPRVTSSIAPSPADWRAAAAAAGDGPHSDSPARSDEGPRTSSEDRSEPPRPPAEWWSPSRPGVDPA
jgi:hypothetical protein